MVSNMYTCSYCGESCNRLINVFIRANLCPDCYEKWKSGTLLNNTEKQNEKAAQEGK